MKHLLINRYIAIYVDKFSNENKYSHICQKNFPNNYIVRNNTLIEFLYKINHRFDFDFYINHIHANTYNKKFLYPNLNKLLKRTFETYDMNHNMNHNMNHDSIILNDHYTIAHLPKLRLIFNSIFNSMYILIDYFNDIDICINFFKYIDFFNFNSNTFNSAYEELTRYNIDPICKCINIALNNTNNDIIKWLFTIIDKYSLKCDFSRIKNIINIKIDNMISLDKKMLKSILLIYEEIDKREQDINDNTKNNVIIKLLKFIDL